MPKTKFCVDIRSTTLTLEHAEGHPLMRPLGVDEVSMLAAVAPDGTATPIIKEPFVIGNVVVVCDVAAVLWTVLLRRFFASNAWQLRRLDATAQFGVTV